MRPWYAPCGPGTVAGQDGREDAVLPCSKRHTGPLPVKGPGVRFRENASRAFSAETPPLNPIEQADGSGVRLCIWEAAAGCGRRVLGGRGPVVSALRQGPTARG